jgi:hypothetical protein
MTANVNDTDNARGMCKNKWGDFILDFRFMILDFALIQKLNLFANPLFCHEYTK